ncbi:MAG: NAD(P)-dependent oxidoreductase [Acidobacteriota bacterium]
MRIGFIGLGNMGMPMARNLLAKGFDLHLYNRTRSKAESLATEGAMLAASPAELAGRVDIVLTCLADIPASEQVFLGEEGIFSGARPGQVLADHSTVDPGTSRKLYQVAEGMGAHFLDAPISGGSAGAEAGSLTIMVGGEEAAFREALPAFEAMGESIVHMGGPGAGTVTKLANQILVAVHTLASCEALLLGIESGVDAEKLTGVLMSAWGASKMLERNAKLISKRQFGPSAVPIRNLAKDLSIIVELGERMGLALPATKQADLIHRMATEHGMALCDFAAIYQVLEQRTAG